MNYTERVFLIYKFIFVRYNDSMDTILMGYYTST